MAVVAVIFDFDDTLVPDSTSALLTAHGIDAKKFWSTRAKALVDDGYDPPLAYMNLLLKEVGPGKPLGELTNQKLSEFGSSLDSTWFPGLPQLFDDLRSDVAAYRSVSIEFYIISGGIQTLIEGSKVVQKYFNGVYGCQFGEDAETGQISSVKRCVTFTEKTRFLFEINKGITASSSRTQPHLVNQYVAEKDRPVPFANMIYVGDGLTDIPCFSLIEKNAGYAFAVFAKGEVSAKQAFQQFLAPRRVHSMHFPEYGPDSELGAVLRAAVAATCAQLSVKTVRALDSS